MKRFLVLATAAATTCLSLGLAGATTAVAAGGVPNPGGGPMVKVVAPHAGLPTVSENWSGYAVTSNKPFTYVHAQFVQPALKCTGNPNRWTSNWTGLDGFNNETVEQDGTFSTCAGPGNMTPQYFAWYEMFPAGSVTVFPVKPGNVIDSSVSYAHGKFTLTIADVTSSKVSTTTAACSSCERASAEWIIERPALCNNSFTHCFLTALANFGTTAMSDATASTNFGHARGINTFNNNFQIFMVQPLKSKKGGFITLDNVGPVVTPSQSFAVQFERPGTTIPITL